MPKKAEAKQGRDKKQVREIHIPLFKKTSRNTHLQWSTELNDVEKYISHGLIVWRQRTLSNSLWRKPFVCLFCDNKYTQDGKLTRHKIIHNRDWNQRWKRERPHKCKSCEKFFPQTHDLKELT